jgi:arginase
MRVFFPLWQGAGIKTRVPEGTVRLRERLGDGITIFVPNDADLEKDGLIRARASLTEAYKASQTVFSDAENTVLIGGDCSSDLTLVAQSNLRYAPDLAVVWLDTHADLNTPQSSPSGHAHGMVLRALLGEGDFQAFVPRALEPCQVFLGGVREFDAPELEYVQASAIQTVSVLALTARPSSLAEIVRQAGFSRVHVHLDLDVLDLAQFSSSGFASHGGLGVSTLEAVIEGLHAHLKMVSFAVTEFAPRNPNDLETVLRLIAALENRPL